MVYAILIAKRKLRHYFDAHPVTKNTIGKVINNREASRKIVKWVLELIGHGITYIPGQRSNRKSLQTSSRNGRRHSFPRL